MDVIIFILVLMFALPIAEAISLIGLRMVVFVESKLWLFVHCKNNLKREALEDNPFGWDRT